MGAITPVPRMSTRWKSNPSRSALVAGPATGTNDACWSRSTVPEPASYPSPSEAICQAYDAVFTASSTGTRRSRKSSTALLMRRFALTFRMRASSLRRSSSEGSSRTAFVTRCPNSVGRPGGRGDASCSIRGTLITQLSFVVDTSRFRANSRRFLASDTRWIRQHPRL